MKLPSSGQMGVQGLGTPDIGSAGRKWAAKTNARNAMNKAFSDTANVVGDIFTAQNDAEDSLLYQERLQADTLSNTKITTYINNTPVVDINDPDTPIEVVEYLTKNKAKYQGDKIDTDSFSLDFLQENARAMQDASVEALKDTDYRDDYVGNMTNQISASYQDAALIQVKQKQERLRSKVIVNIDGYIQDGNEPDARAAIERNVNQSRLLTPEEGATMLVELGGKIDYANLSQEVMTAPVGDLAQTSTDIWDSRMTSSEKMALAAKADTRITASISDAKAAETKRQDDISKDLQNQVLAGLSDGGAVSWTLIDSLRDKVSPDDMTAIITLNRALEKATKTAGIQSDPAAVDVVNKMLVDLASPYVIGYDNDPESQSSTQRQRRDMVTATITQSVANGTISGADALALTKQLNSVESIPYNSEEYKLSVDRIYGSLVNVSKSASAMTKDLAGSPAMMLAYEMERELQDTIRNRGANFNALEWVDENIPRFVTESYYTTLAEVREQQGVKQFLDVNSRTNFVDEDKTWTAFRAAVASSRGPQKEKLLAYEKELNTLIRISKQAEAFANKRQQDKDRASGVAR